MLFFFFKFDSITLASRAAERRILVLIVTARALVANRRPPAHTAALHEPRVRRVVVPRGGVLPAHGGLRLRAKLRGDADGPIRPRTVIRIRTAGAAVLRAAAALLLLHKSEAALAALRDVVLLWVVDVLADGVRAPEHGVPAAAEHTRARGAPDEREDAHRHDADGAHPLGRHRPWLRLQLHHHCRAQGEHHRHRGGQVGLREGLYVFAILFSPIFFLLSSVIIFSSLSTSLLSTSPSVLG